MRHRLSALAAAAAFAVLPAVAAADTHLIQKQHTDAMSLMGHDEPAKDETIETWMSKTSVARRGGSIDMIARFDEKKLYVINNPDRAYSVIALPFDFKSLLSPEQQPMAEQMEKMMAVDVTVTPKDETKQVGKWATKRYDLTVTGMGMKMDIVNWVSKDVGVDRDTYKEFIGSMANLQMRSDWMKKLAEIDGYPVEQDMTMTIMGKPIRSHSELVSVDERAAPAGTYEPPAGYTERKYDPMKAMQAGRGSAH